MIIKTTHKMATSLIIISSLMALPNISYSKEVKNEDFLSKLLSSFTSKNETPKTTQIFEEFLKLLPKSPSDKVNGAALIRLANQLSTDLKTIYEIKRNIAFQFVQSQGITLVLNDKTERPKITEVKKEEELDNKEASSSTMPWIAGLAGAGLVGGGGGSSSSTTTTFLDETTSYTYSSSLDSTWTARQEYKNVGQYTDATDNTQTSAINPYTLVGVNNAYARGLSGTGKTIAIMDTKFLTGTTHLDFVIKNNAGKIATYGTLTAGSSGTNYHGAHVMGLVAGDYNSNSSSHNTYYSGSSFDKLKYGTMGVAYNAGLHLSDFNQTESSSYQKHFASATDSAKTAGAIAQNNSWRFSNAAYTINYFKNLQDNNGYSDLAIYASITDTEANWSSYVTALNNFQTTGVIVRSSGNNYSADSVGAYAGMPIIFSELAEAWLTVGNVDVTGSTLSSSTVSRKGNPCGIAAEFCINADGFQVTSTYGDSNTDNNRYGILSGTSMAAPIVSGSIALLSEAFPQIILQSNL